MVDASVRPLTDDELADGARLVGRQMLGSVTDEAAQGWADLWRPHRSHGAFVGDELAGVALWFATRLATPGEPLDAAGVTAVAVLSHHRRQGHLTRLMDAQLRSVADAGVPVAVLIAAESPIYGRFGYGAATEGTRLELDTRAARFRDAPVGSIAVADPPALRQGLQQAYELQWSRTPGAILRDDDFWDMFTGIRARPGHPLDVAQQRGALWYDPTGALGGAVLYKVEERWTHGRPDGPATVELLAAASPVGERELWRHLCTVDWVTTVTAEARPVDDLLPLWLVDNRAVRQTEQFDNVWLRILDLPAAMGARRSAVTGSLVLQVDDPLGYVDGRWRVDLGPDTGSAVRTTDAADLRLSAGTLSTAFLGGRTLEHLGRAGLVQEERAGALQAATPVFATPVAPWGPLDF